MIVTIYSAIVILANLIFIALLAVHAFRWKATMFSEPGNPVVLALYCLGLQFLAAFGISDFSISIVVYRKFHLVEDKKLPGTLMNCCVVPVAVMAIGYLTVIKVETMTLLTCVVCGFIGALIGSFVVSRLDTRSIQLMMIIALVLAAGTIIIKLAGIMPSGGEDFGFRGWKLIVVAIVTMVLSALSMGGFAVTAILLSFFYIMGLNPLAAFPLAMGTCSLACAVGGIKYTLKGNFGIKLAVLSTIFGSIGAFIAVTFVKNLNVNIIQWFILAVIIYSCVTMIVERIKGDWSGIRKYKSQMKKGEVKYERKSIIVSNGRKL